MNQELSAVSSSTRLTSKPRASMETSTTQQAKGVESSQEAQEMEHLKQEMEQMNQALSLASEIRASLQSALKNLSPAE